MPHGTGRAVNSHDFVLTLLHVQPFFLKHLPVSLLCYISFVVLSSYFFFPVWDNHHHHLIILVALNHIVMTSSSPTPDISSLSLSSHPTHQRLHDTYDYDGTSGDVRSQYHFATSPPVPQGQPLFQPLSMNQSPLKSKPSRAGLPTVRLLFPPSPHFFCRLLNYHSFYHDNNLLLTAMARWRFGVR